MPENDNGNPSETNVPQTKPESPEVKTLKEQKLIATLKKDIAEADTAKQLAEQKRKPQTKDLPAPQTKPLDSKVETDAEFGYVAELTAYQAMSGQADTIAQAVVDQIEEEDARILIVDSFDMSEPDVPLFQVKNLIENWNARLNSLTSDIQNLLHPEEQPRVAAALSPSTAATMVGLTADLFGYFQAQYSIKGRKIAMPNAALHAMVAGKVRQKADPKRFDVFFPNFHRIKSSPIMKEYGHCVWRRANLAQAKTELSEQMADKFKDNANAKKYLGEAEAALKEFDEFVKQITTVPEGAQSSTLVRAAIRDFLNLQKVSHLLYLAVSSAGGESIVKKWLWTNPKLSFVGGGAFIYVLAQCDGQILAADTVVGVSHGFCNLAEGNRVSFY